MIKDIKFDKTTGLAYIPKSYFEKNPNSRFGNLADNVRAPFNEYLGFLIQFGVTGILLLSVLLFFYIQKKPDNNYRR